ncbi:MAG: TetR/AcrR family transcriptional regulator [Verrucomicrobiota bacterium]
MTTKERILFFAESLFAEHGYTGVSLRQITTAAKVNLASVNYHYYDKERLYREILRRRMAQINRERVALLTEAQVRAGEAPPPLPAIFDALARPLFLPSAEAGPVAPRLLGRLLSERQPIADDLLREEFQPAMTRFGQAIRRHCVGLPPADFVWRLSFVIGALHHALVTLPDMSLHTGGLCQSGDREGALKNFVNFSAKAFAA